MLHGIAGEQRAAAPVRFFRKCFILKSFQVLCFGNILHSSQELQRRLAEVRITKQVRCDLRVSASS